MYTAPTDIYTLSLHDALPIFHHAGGLTCLPENVRHGAVNLGVPTAAPFVMQVPRVPDTGEHEAVPYPRYDGFVAREPGDRADSPGNKKETVRVAAPRALQVPREVGGQDHARQVVVAERGVTNVTGHEDLVGSFTREHQLPIGQMPGRERRIDPDFVVPTRKRFQLGVRPP